MWIKDKKGKKGPGLLGVRLMELGVLGKNLWIIYEVVCMKLKCTGNDFLPQVSVFVVTAV